MQTIFHSWLQLQFSRAPSHIQIFILIMGGLLAGAAHTVQAQTVTDGAIGRVNTLQGDVTMTLFANRTALRIGSPIALGAQITTQGASSVGITFIDNTLISIGPHSELVIDHFVYAPQQGKASLIAWLGKGTMNYMSGLIAKMRPEAVQVNTPTGMIGVRGTHFATKVDDQW
jgi:hypothetical protein